MTITIRVSAQSRTTHVAGCIAKTLRIQQSMTVQAIGASAVNQAVKAVAIARGYLSEDGLDVVMRPRFDMAGDLEECTVVMLSLERVSIA